MSVENRPAADAGGQAPVRLRAEEVRRRERRRRYRGPLWDALSVLFHAALIALLAWFTPLREIVLPERRPAEPRDIAREMPPERVAEVSERIEEARLDELQQQLQEMQDVLRNMEVMRDALEEDYDRFAESQAEPVRDELSETIEEVARRQTAATNVLESLEERLDRVAENAAADRLTETNSAEWNEAKALSEEIEARLAEAADDQGNAVNDLDRTRMLAEFAGFEETARKADDLRERQMEAARETASVGREAIAQADRFRELAPTLAELASQRQKEASLEERREKAERERDARASERDENASKADAEQQAENRARNESRDEKNKANAERDQARRERDQANREKDQAKRERDQAKREKDQARQDENRASQERDQARNDSDKARQERDQAKGDSDKARQERDQAKGDTDKARQERDQAKGDTDKARQERDQAKRDADKARQERDQAKRDADKARQERDQARKDSDKARQERDQADRLRKEGKTADAENRDRAAAQAESSAKQHEEAAAKAESSAKQREEAAAQAEASAKEREKAAAQAESSAKQRQQAAAQAEASAKRHEQAAEQAESSAKRHEQAAEQAESSAKRHEQAAEQAESSAKRHQEEAAKREQAAAERDQEAAKREQAAAERDAAAKKADEASREAEKTANAARDRASRMRSERDAAQRGVQTAERDLSQIRNELQRAQESVRTLDQRRKELTAFIADPNAREQRRRFARAVEEQARLRAETDRLLETLARDEASPDPLTDGEPERNELAEESTDGLSMTEAYEMALRLEGAITETYKDVRAASAAVEKRVPFAEAQRLTDVPLPVHPEPDLAALESTPGTKEELDRKAAAQSELVRETGEMADASVSMMSDALSLLFSEGREDAVRRDGARRSILRLTPEMLAGRDGGSSARLGRMYEMASLNDRLAEQAKANGWRQGARTGGAASGGGNHRERYLRDASAGPAGRREQIVRVGGPGRHGERDDLLPGSVLRTAAGSGDGIPGAWMYLHSWYVIGPFPNPNRVNVTRKFPPESVVDLNATYPGRDGKTLRWEFTQARSVSPINPGWAHRRAEVVPNNAIEYGIWYGYTEVRVDRDCELWLAVGSDDRSDMWVNGEQVWSSVSQRKEWHIDESISERPIFFHAGVNTVLFRLENGPGPTGFSVCLSPADEPPPL